MTGATRPRLAGGQGRYTGFQFEDPGKRLVETDSPDGRDDAAGRSAVESDARLRPDAVRKAGGPPEPGARNRRSLSRRPADAAVRLRARTVRHAYAALAAGRQLRPALPRPAHRHARRRTDRKSV